MPNALKENPMPRPSLIREIKPDLQEGIPVEEAWDITDAQVDKIVFKNGQVSVTFKDDTKDIHIDVNDHEQVTFSS